MLYREIIAVCSPIHTKPIHFIHSKNLKPLTAPKTSHWLPIFRCPVSGTLDFMHTVKVYGEIVRIAPLILNLEIDGDK